MKLSPSILLFLLPLLEACQVYLVRFKDTEIYLAKDIPRAEACTYSAALSAVSQTLHALGPQHAVYHVSKTRLLVTDTETIEPNQEAKWVKASPAALRRAFSGPFDDKFEDHFQSLGHTPVMDVARKVGLVNVSLKTCYLNAGLQCLYHVPEFLERLSTVCIARDFNIYSIPGALWSALFTMANKGISPSSEIMLNLVMRINEKRKHKDLALIGTLGLELSQNDSSEILRFVLDQLNTEVSVTGTNPLVKNGIFDDLFKIRMQIKTESMLDGDTRYQDADSNMFLLVPDMEVSFEAEKIRQTRMENLKGLLKPEYVQQVVPGLRELSLTGLLNDALNNDLTYDYDSGTPVLRTKVTRELLQLPPYLFISVDRAGFVARLNNQLDFPITGLDLTSRVKDNVLNDRLPYLYDLAAVVMHIGPSSMSGHYTCLVKNQISGYFNLHDDNFVGRDILNLRNGSIPAEYKKNVAYLMYKRRNF